MAVIPTQMLDLFVILIRMEGDLPKIEAIETSETRAKLIANEKVAALKKSLGERVPIHQSIEKFRINISR